MSRSEQETQNAQHEVEKAAIEKDAMDKLPLESSPYVKYSDIEEYKLHGYGAEGHLEVKPDQGGGTTDGPTPSGSSTTNIVAGLSTNASNPNATQGGK